MKLVLHSQLVIFPKDTFKEIKLKDKFHVWIRLQQLLRNKEFEERSLEVVLGHYDSISDVDGFIDIQLKFYLLRISQDPNEKPKDLGAIIRWWILIVEKKIPMNLNLKLFPMRTYFSPNLKVYGKYFISLEEYFEYIKSWNSCTVDLDAWKKFKYLSIPKDFMFLKPMLDKRETVHFIEDHMRKLFEDYVEEIYLEKFKSRLANKIFAETDKASIERILQNNGTDDDKKYLNNLVTTFYSWKTFPNIFFVCLEGKGILHPNNMDINSPENYAGYFALIKYYEVLKGKTEKKKLPTKAMWFKNSSVNSNDELKFALQDIFDMIKKYCPNSSWIDFKSIFNKNGASTRIEWTGEAELLNFIFRKLHPVVTFSGGKWDVVAQYFYRSDPNDRSLDADKLPGSSHYDFSKNDKLSTQLDTIISILRH